MFHTSNTTLKVTRERAQATEILFDPTLIGSQNKGIDENVSQAFKKLSKEQAEQIGNKLVLSGGTSLINGFDSRLLFELEKKQVKVNISSPKQRQLGAFLGAEILASTSSCVWVSSQAYSENGPDILDKISYISESEGEQKAVAPTKHKADFTKITRVQALYDYQTNDPSRLPFLKGDVLFLQHKCFPEWWKACFPDGENVGLIPSNFVREIEPLSVFEVGRDPNVEKRSEQEILRLSDRLGELQNKLNTAMDEERTLKTRLRNFENLIAKKKSELQSVDSELIQKRRLLEQGVDEEKLVSEKVKAVNETLMELSDVKSVKKGEEDTMKLSMALFENLQKLGSAAQVKEQQVIKANQKLEVLNKKAEQVEEKIDRKKKRLTRMSIALQNSNNLSDPKKFNEELQKLIKGDEEDEEGFKTKEISEAEKVKREFFFSIALEMKTQLIEKGIFVVNDLNDYYEQVSSLPYTNWLSFLKNSFERDAQRAKKSKGKKVVKFASSIKKKEKK